MKKQHNVRNQLFAGIVIAVTITAARADPIPYQITFTASHGLLPTSGTFTYDAALPLFTNFLVNWDGLTWDLTNTLNFGANNPLVINPLPSCIGTLTGPAASFALLSGICNGIPGTSVRWFANAPTDHPLNSVVLFEGGPITNGVQSGLDVGARQNDGSGHSGQGTWTITPVPEPSTYALIGITLLAMSYRKHRTRQQ